MYQAQVLDNLKRYMAERRNQLQEWYECTNADYTNGKLDGIEEIINYLQGEEMAVKDWNTDYDSWDFHYDIYEL
jgi:hypothetical protein